MRQPYLPEAFPPGKAFRPPSASSGPAAALVPSAAKTTAPSMQRAARRGRPPYPGLARHAGSGSPEPRPRGAASLTHAPGDVDAIFFLPPLPAADPHPPPLGYAARSLVRRARRKSPRART